MKILFKGNIMNPTGISTANRELVLALKKLGNQIQVMDPFLDSWEFNKGLERFNNAINVKSDCITIFADYPQFWQLGYGKLFGLFLHEGTVLRPDWVQAMNRIGNIIVPSESCKNLFKWNGVISKIHVVPYGTDEEVYKPSLLKGIGDYLFLSVNSWTGNVNDRKGTDLLIKAFDEEFKDEKVKLILKIGTFWESKPLEFYVGSIINILGHVNKNILINNSYMSKTDLAEIYQKSDCFVAPTRGEGFGLTILDAMAVGLPVIVTKDLNSGHTDFCKGKDSVLWIDAPKMAPADPRFYHQGNMQPVPDISSLRKQMRYAFEHREELFNKGLNNSEEIRQNWSWKESAKKMQEVLNG